jgi:hypothetical protein
LEVEGRRFRIGGYGEFAGWMRRGWGVGEEWGESDAAEAILILGGGKELSK